MASHAVSSRMLFAQPLQNSVRYISRKTCLKDNTNVSSLTIRSKSTQAVESNTLSWSEYLSIRRAKRRWETSLTIPCAIVGFGAGVVYFGSLEIDPTKTIMGLDPFFFYGFCTVGTTAAGALVGPSFGALIWRTLNRRYISMIDAKDREFFQHIAKNRVDASMQSPTSPVPDYYGEKIGSLHQYRKWLRDQARYRRKVTFMEE